MPDQPNRSTPQRTRRFYLFATDLPAEEIARVINSVAPERDISGDEILGPHGEDQNTDKIDDTHERVLDPSEEPDK